MTMIDREIDFIFSVESDLLFTTLIWLQNQMSYISINNYMFYL